jgi:hypothetical protein
VPTAHITLRISKELLSAVESAAKLKGIDRSKWIKDRMREGLDPGDSQPGVAPDLTAIQELLEVEIPGIQESLTALQEGAPLLESVLKLCIETVMIGRQLALKAGDRLLEQAQMNAREYYAKSASPARLAPGARPDSEGPYNTGTER